MIYHRTTSRVMRQRRARCGIASAWRLGQTLVAIALLITFASPASAQVYGELMPEPYRFASLVNDLHAAGLDPSPTAVVDAYRKAIETWAKDQSELRSSLRKATGTDVTKYFGLAEIDRALKVIHRARSAAESSEEALFGEIALAVPEESRDRVARVRDWRRTQRAVPRSISFGSFMYISDIGDLVRRSHLPDEVLAQAVAALEPSEASRRAALLQLQRANDDGIRASAKIVDEAGAAGKPRETANRDHAAADNELMQKTSHARIVSGETLAEAMGAQLKAYRAVAPLLPRHQRRAVLDQFGPSMIPGEQYGQGLDLPRPARTPSDVARRVLAWKELSVAQRAATRAIVTKWLDEDDAAILAGLDGAIAALRQSNGLSADVSENTRQTQQKRKAIAATRLAEIAKASGAEWLVDASIPTPGLDEIAMTAEDRDAIGVDRPRVTSAPTSANASRSDFLPIPLDESARRRAAQLLAGSDETLAMLERLLRDDAEQWERELRPTIETAQTLVRLLATNEFGSIGDEEITSNVAALRDARRAAFAASDAHDAALAEALHQKLGDSAAPAIAAFIASRRLDESVALVWRPFSQLSIDLSRIGGLPCNVAATVLDESVPLDVRRAAAASLSGDWPAVVALAKDMRTVQIDASYGEGLSRTQSALVAMQRGGDPDAAPNAESPDHFARIAALIVALERWQMLEDALVAKAIDSASTAGDVDGALRTAIDRARFSRAYYEVTSVETAQSALATAGEFPNRAELLRELRLCHESLLALARRRADVLRPRIKLSSLSGEARRYPGMDRGWEELATMLVQTQLYSAATWLIDRMTPKEVVAASPELRTALQYANW